MQSLALTITQKFAICNQIARSAILSASTRRSIYQTSHLSSEAETPTDEASPESNEKQIDPAIDRTKVIPVETSIKYMKSSAYTEAYGDKRVWELYRRNHKGLFPPRKTRKTCIRKGQLSTGNPCPICRDEYLVLDHRNLDLLHQFISDQTGSVLSYSKTGLCQRKHEQLLIAVERAKDYGLVTYDVPFRDYDYSLYYDQAGNSKN